MALQLTEEQASGVSGNYWRVENVRIDARSGTAEVRVVLYKDSAARQADKEPLRTKCYYLTDYTIAALDEDNPVALAYIKIKALPEFAEAADV